LGLFAISTLQVL